jgi:thiamine-monophosphate kinase
VLPADLLAQARLRLERPEPRVALGLALRGLASAAIDLSDGLVGDLGHVLKASGVGASLQTQALGGLLQASAHPQWPQGGGQIQVLEEVLSGGDDYELLFTAPPLHRQAIHSAALRSHTPVTCIGRIDAEVGLRLVDAQGHVSIPSQTSFDHFKAG